MSTALAEFVRTGAEPVFRPSALADRDSIWNHRQRMEAVGCLAGGLAHEINNLLQAIHGFTCFAMDELPVTSQAYRDLEESLAAITRASTIARQLLQFSRAGKREVQAVDPGLVLKELNALLRPLIGEHVDTQIGIAPEIPRIRADRGLLQQALINLCINARDAMPQGGQLRLTVGTAELRDRRAFYNRELDAGAYVVFRVQDSGCGIPTEVLHKVFDPFFTTKEAGKGTGLGLSMVYNTVNALRGGISIDSQELVGTTIEIYLPPANDQLAELPTSATEPPCGGGQTILLAEDESVVRSVTERILRGAGYVVLAAASGEEAIRLFEQHATEVDALLLDSLMPRMSGRETYERIHAMNPHVPVLFATGYDPETTRHVGVDGLRDNVIFKPFSRDELLTRLANLFSEQLVGTDDEHVVRP